MNSPSALIKAIQKACLQSVKIALDRGAPLEEPDVHGDPGLPLRIACFNGHADIVLELIRRGADIDAPNSEGPGSPVRMAARANRADIVRLLLALGATLPPDVSLPDAPPPDRRERRERRNVDSGPPAGVGERRRLAERRAISVCEIQLSATQWAAYFPQHTASAMSNPKAHASPPRPRPRHNR